MMLATAIPSAFVLALFRLVPLSGRLSLWLVPALYVGIAASADEVVQSLHDAAVRRRWLLGAGALVCGVLVARLCANIYRIGELE